MTIGERIRKLRKNLDLTQQKFGERIGIKGNTVAQYELGRNEPIDAVLSLICREFNVRKEWLRTGEGEIFNLDPSDILDQLADKYQLSNADYVMIEKFVSLKPEARRAIFKFFHDIDSKLQSAGMDPYALAYGETSEPKRQGMTVEQAEAEYIKKISNSAQNTGSIALNTTGETESEKKASNG